MLLLTREEGCDPRVHPMLGPGMKTLRRLVALVAPLAWCATVALIVFYGQLRRRPVTIARHRHVRVVRHGERYGCTTTNAPGSVAREVACDPPR